MVNYEELKRRISGIINRPDISNTITIRVYNKIISNEGEITKGTLISTNTARVVENNNNGVFRRAINQFNIRDREISLIILSDVNYDNENIISEFEYFGEIYNLRRIEQTLGRIGNNPSILDIITLTRFGQ